ncbi:MAG: site-specific DNA-methyltransferase [Candidatus Pacebacteria bacterium]|nr:site-specific DNA-methyltransferase [Candidatus Paceibacterota bacterium]
MNKLKQTLEKALKSEPTFFDSESGELNYTKIKDSADMIDEKLINLLADNKDLKAKFFTKIKDIYVFNIQDFKFFLDESKIDNSYTKYANKIGLSDKNGLLENVSDVVLDFPFKDCVLEGGQSTEEGADTYFEFSDKTGKYEEKNGKRNEIFFNQVLAQDEIDRLFDSKALVNWKRFTKDSKKDGEAVKEIKRDKTGLIQENLIIKGNNLLALHSLKSEFAGKIKLIYIDPPYGKDADSFYNDNFKRSTWLTFMKNRLEIAKDLLTKDGLIFIQIDEEQFAYLKVLADGIFDKFVTLITAKTRSDYGVAQEDFLYTVTEHILVYANSKPVNYEKYITKKISEDSKFFSQYNQILANLGTEEKYKQIETGRVGKVSIYKHEGYQIKSIPKEKRNIEFYISNLDLIIRTSNSQGGFLQKIYKEIPEKGLYSVEYTPTKGSNKGEIFRYYILDRGTILWAKNLFNNSEELERNVILTNLWDDISWLGIANEGGVKLKNGKKPEALIKRIIETSTKNGDIVLDYHLGSGTSCAVAHKMNRQYIGIEQLDYEENDSVVRLKNVINGDNSGISKIINWKGGGEFIYCELAKWNEQAKEEIQNAKDLPALVKLFDTLYERYFLNYNVKIKDFKDKIIKEENFKKLTLAQQKKMFLTMLDLNQMYVQESEMADKKYGISSEDQKLTKAFYSKK